MPFAIVAEYPLGTYRAHVGEGQTDTWASPLRLHAALLSAAGLGTRAEVVDGQLQPSAIDLRALQWVEQNPPDGLALPLKTANAARADAFREMGLLKPKMLGTKKDRKSTGTPIALSDSVSYIWEADPPADVLGALEDLCPDVPYLGQAESPVRLRIASSGKPTHHRADPGGLRPPHPRTIELAAPRAGRTDALVAAHNASVSRDAPSTSSDRPKVDENDLRASTVGDAAGVVRYVPEAEQRSVGTPWEFVWVLPLDDATPPIGLEDRVTAAVALHRALISLIGDGAPSILTGHYGRESPMPPNRVAIHLIDKHPAMATQLPTRQAFVVAVPPGTDAADLQVIGSAIDKLREVRSRLGVLRLDRKDHLSSQVLDAGTFWSAPSPGVVRCWVTSPAVPETRQLHGGWSLADAVAMSVGMVWRAQLTDAHPELARARGEHRYRRLASLAVEHAVEVYDVRLLTTTPAERYVHRAHDELIIRPYVGTLSLGDLQGDGRALAALGQSRHLGGGLLLPLDVPTSTHELWRQTWPR